MIKDYKGYTIKEDARRVFLISNASGKGVIPVKLRGMFSAYAPAKQAIDAYLDAKGSKDDKAGSAS